MTKFDIIVLASAIVPFLIGLWVDLVSCRANLSRIRSSFFRNTKISSPIPIVGLILYLFSFLLTKELRSRPSWVDVSFLFVLLFHFIVHFVLPAIAFLFVSRYTRGLRLSVMVVALAIPFLAAYEVFSLDGLYGLVSSLGSTDCTSYAADYSPEKYRRIRKGMTVEQTLSLGGEPIGCRIRNHAHAGRCETIWHEWSRECRERVVANPDILERLCYTKSNPSDSSYRIRDVVFKNGEVDYKFSEFYGD